MRNNSMRARGCVSIATITTTMHHRKLRDLARGRGQYFAAALAEWPSETAADQHPLAEHLQHQTGTHSVPSFSEQKGGVCGELSDHSNQWLHCDVKTFESKAFVME